MNLGKLFGGLVKAVKQNPEKALAVAVLLGGPIGKVAAKAAPIVIAATAKREPEA